MKFNKDLAAIHGYLCADGYVIRNSETQKHKFYVIGFRNYNLTLLRDFQSKFFKQFNKKPKLRKDGRCIINSKEIYFGLIKKFDSFYSREWTFPNIHRNYLKYWLSAFFDCEGWVIVKGRQNRQIGADSINYKGLKQISKALKIFNIETKLRENKGRNSYRLYIFGKDNLIRYQEKIGFLHNEKKRKLKEAIKSYMNYYWKFPKDGNKLRKFVREILKRKAKSRKENIVRIISNKEKNLISLSNSLTKLYDIHSKLYKRINGYGTIYYELNIHKKEEVKKLIRHRLLNKKEIKRLTF